MSTETKDNGFTPLGATLDNDNQPTVELPPSSENGMFFLFLLIEQVKKSIVQFILMIMVLLVWFLELLTYSIQMWMDYV